MASGILDDHPDTTARAYHAEYEKFGTSKPAEISWGFLQERFRVSNRRAVAHIPAKLASLGHDLTEYLSGAQSAQAPLSPNAQPRLESGKELYANEDQLMAIASLEHDRWMMDRYLDGWRYGAERNDDARFHDNLIPFDQLDSVVQSYDIQLARWLGEYLTTS